MTFLYDRKDRKWFERETGFFLDDMMSEVQEFVSDAENYQIGEEG